jgi:TonB family protein
MSSEERVKAEPCPGSFIGCLVEGDAEQNTREKRTKRRALTISIALQAAGLAGLVIAPLLAKPAGLVIREATPIPPYGHNAARHERAMPAAHQPAQVCLICPTSPVRPAAPTPIQENSPIGSNDEIIDVGPIGSGNSSKLLYGPDNRPQPVRPAETPRETNRVVVGHIDPALLVHRVEPVFPALARQLHRNGKVELRAVIASDGGIQSLEVVSGDPLFISSAMEAVRRWHYKPTYLNGQAVEIDTFITVIYTLQ